MKRLTLIDRFKEICCKGADPFFSIYVTTYKDKPYIRECLESLARQGLSEKDFELIISNDASNDGTVEVVNEFIRENPNLNIKFFINEKNLGVSESRNKAIEMSKGKYIVPMDGDDYLNDNALKGIMKLIKETDADLVLPKIVKFYESDVDEFDRPSGETIDIDIDVNKINQLKGEDFFSTLRSRGVRLGQSILSKKLIEENGLKFENTLCEDDIFTLKAYLVCQNPKIYYKPYYNYRKRKGSRSRQNIKGIVEKKLDLSIEALRLINDHPNYTNLLHIFSQGYYEYAQDFMKRLNCVDRFIIRNDFKKRLKPAAKLRTHIPTEKIKLPQHAAI